MIKRTIGIYLILSFSLFGQVYSQNKDNLAQKSAAEIESELVDFKAIRKELKKDGLENSAKKFTNRVEVVKKKRIKKVKRKFSYPRQDDFWTFFSELWLVRNSQLLKWDFRKPDYGLVDTFRKFLERFGFYNKTVKILYIDSPNITHMGLPSNPNEYIFLISVPFIRTLDLSKLEISLLLFEDFLRLEAKYFIKNINNKKLKKLLGRTFYKKNFDKKTFEEVMKSYDEISLIKGFNFQQQFNVTKLMNTYLVNDMKYWNSYYKLLGKLDLLVKSNLMYQKHIKIYPSPELQLNWLKPTKKKKF